ILLCPLFSTAQNYLPRFENDTLTTTTGYKIYKGQILQLANGSSAAGYFKYIKFHVSLAKNNTYSLQNSRLLVNRLRNYKNAGDDISIRIQGIVTYADGKKEETDIIMDFEKAIAGSGGLPAELTVPEAFKTSLPQTMVAESKKQPAAAEPKKGKAADNIKDLLVADEIKKLFELYQAGALTKEEFETQKKKLLDRQ
ncbi:MAG: SHOCT domain-containing protein, partial [Ferruginibacter sp.]